MAAGLTYESIATTTLGSNATNVEFTSISGSYTDLVLIMSIASSSGNDISIRFNGNTSAIYSFTRLRGNGTAVSSNNDTNSSYGRLTDYGAPSSTVGDNNCILQINNYSNSTTFKTYLSRANNPSQGLDAVVGLWRSTAAITSINLSTDSFGGTSTLLTGSTFTLYGIAKA